MIFVFGSNEAGIHGAGAALYARQHCGAVIGVGVGRRGNSFALPTKDTMIETLPAKSVKNYVDQFLIYARLSPDQFQVTAVGCGLAGFTHKHIAPMFADAPDNCWFDLLWKPFLGENRKYWGTYADGKYNYSPEYQAIQEKSINRRG
jgi:hypothetical protein